MNEAVVAVIAGGFALLGGLVNHWFEGKRRKEDRAEATRARAEERDRAEQRQWRDRGAEVIAALRPMVTDAHPKMMTVNFDMERSREAMFGLLGRWETMRSPLARLAAGHPSSEVRTIAREAGDKIEAALNRVAWIINDMIKRTEIIGGTEALQEAAATNEQALQILDTLAAALHRDSC